jgi:hypothetical protein
MEVHAMRTITRISLTLLSALALSSSAVVSAQATGSPASGAQATGTSGTLAADRFTFTLPKAPDSLVDPDRMHVVVNRWSTNEERDRLFGIVSEQGSEHVLREFRATGAIGYLRWPGGLEYSLRYAHRAPRPDGGSDIVLIVDRPVWIWWDESAPKVSTERFAYTAVQMRLDKAGTGDGRLADPSAVAADKAAGIIVNDYDQLASRLTDVRRDDRQ